MYDPRDPVPTRGGRLLGVGGAAAGAFDQREVETRDDVLVYTTPPLDQPLEVTGPVRVELWAATSAPDTDFTAKLVEVHADGRAINLCDGIVRARAFVPTPLAPGAAYRFTIELWEISALIAAGNRAATRDLVEQLPALRAQLQLRQADRHRHRRRHPDRRSDRLPRRAPPQPAHPAGNSPLSDFT